MINMYCCYGQKPSEIKAGWETDRVIMSTLLEEDDFCTISQSAVPYSLTGSSRKVFKKYTKFNDLWNSTTEDYTAT